MDKNFIVQAYLNGEDLPNNITIDEFEDDSELMFLAILSSGDKKLYDFCSDRVKKDYQFVNLMVRKFSSDHAFIEEVADYFLQNYTKEEPDEKIKILLLLIQILDQKDYDIELLKYKVPLDLIYQKDMLSIVDAVDKEPEKYGIGFNIIEELYDHDTEILNYYANQMVTSVFPLNIAKLEDSLREHNYKTEAIMNTLPITFIVNFVKNYDIALSAYIALHPEVFKDLSKSFSAVQSNWDRYNNELLNLKVNGFLDTMVEHEQWDFYKLALLVYIITKYNVKDIFVLHAENDIEELFERYKDFINLYNPNLNGQTIYEQVAELFNSFANKRYLLDTEKTFNRIWNAKTISEAREIISEYLDTYLIDNNEANLISLPNK